MAHEFGCWTVCWLKPALNLFLFLGFSFKFPCLHFRRLFFAFTQKTIEIVFFFKILFAIKNANRKTMYHVFSNTFLPATAYAKQLDLSFEKHMPCYVHRTQF